MIENIQVDRVAWSFGFLVIISIQTPIILLQDIRNNRNYQVELIQSTTNTLNV